MKIVCGSCGAKYSIADEKVQGKVFKIRCKKCSNVIVVKGNEDGDETMSSTVGNSVASEWYVVVDGEQVGPVAISEIDAYFMAGRINADTFAWKDGLTDWVALSKLDEFAHLSELGGAGPEEATQISDDFSLYQKQVNAEADETSVMSTSSDFGSASGGGAFSAFESSVAEEDPNSFSAGFSDFGSSEVQDDFGYAKAGGTSDDSAFESGGLFSSFDEPAGGPQLQSGNVGGMFASFDSEPNNDDFLGLSTAEPAAPSRTKSSVGGSAAMANASVGSELVGKRNENSVLFSLSSLDQVQAVGGGAAGNAGADVPVTDGSGLIDIRALASAHKSMMSPGGGNDGGGVDPFTTGTMAMPALMPMGSHRSNKPLIIGGVVGGILLFGIVGALAYIVLSKKDDVAPVEPEIRYLPAPVAETTEAEKAAAKEAADAEKNALAGNEPTEVAVKDTPEAKDPKDTKSGSSRKTPDKKNEPAVAAPKEEDKPAPKKEEPKGDGIDRLLNSIDEGTAKKESKKTTSKPKEESSSSSGGKDKLDKSDVLNTIKAYSGRINTCYKSANANNLSGTMKVKFFIKPNGSVTNTEIVSGNFAGTDVGRCVQKAVGGMKFPSTSAKDNVPVTYPFKLE